MKAPFLAIACLLACALVLAACGGSDSDDSASADSGGPTEALSASIPTAVKDAVTKGVEDRRYATEVAEVRALEVEGDKATVEVKLLGGTLHEQTVEATLVRDGKGWKLDRMVRFLDFDKQRMVQEYVAETERLPENFAPKVVRCLTKGFSASSQAEIEAMYLHRNKKLFLALGKPCLNN